MPGDFSGYGPNPTRARLSPQAPWRKERSAQVLGGKRPRERLLCRSFIPAGRAKLQGESRSHCAGTTSPATTIQARRGLMDAYQRIVLASRPVAAPTLDTFRLETGAMPRPAAGQLLVRTQYLSLDTYIRGRMSSAPPYVQPVAGRDPTEGGGN